MWDDAYTPYTHVIWLTRIARYPICSMSRTLWKRRYRSYATWPSLPQPFPRSTRMYVEIRCSVLQCVAVCCRVLQYFEICCCMCCSMLIGVRPWPTCEMNLPYETWLTHTWHDSRAKWPPPHRVLFPHVGCVYIAVCCSVCFVLQCFRNVAVCWLESLPHPIAHV